MSFSGKVKEELAGQLSLARHCQVAELAALLCGCGRVEKNVGWKQETVDPDRK